MPINYAEVNFPNPVMGCLTWL